MYCQSCKTKLSPRDPRCPTCGRRVATSRDLGAGSAAEDDSQASGPLPPASSLEEDSMSQIPSPKPKAPAKKRRRPPALGSQPEPSVGLRRQDVVGLLLEQPSLLEPGLEIYREDGKTCGVGYSTDVGEIDLLARDDAGSLVVIHVSEPGHGKELVGELLQRIGWVRRHLGSSEAEVVVKPLYWNCSWSILSDNRARCGA